jgi:hypothetical protein
VGGSGAPPAADAAAPTAELTLDTVEFCLLVGDRRQPTEPEITVVGDDALAAELLAVAAQLSRP